MEPRSDFNRRDVVLLVTVVVGFVTILVAANVAEYVIEERVRQDLRTVFSKSSTVVLNGQQLSDPSPVLAALRGITDVASHHSHATLPIHVEVKGGYGTRLIVVARDSENANEFWVYHAGWNWQHESLGQYAGRVVSSNLNVFLQNRGL